MKKKKKKEKERETNVREKNGKKEQSSFENSD